MKTKLIEERQERYRVGHNSLDVERFTELFTDDVDYSDHGMGLSLVFYVGKRSQISVFKQASKLTRLGIGVTGLNKEAAKALATSVFGSCEELEFTTVSVNGTDDFSAWEWVRCSLFLLFASASAPSASKAWLRPSRVISYEGVLQMETKD